MNNFFKKPKTRNSESSSDLDSTENQQTEDFDRLRSLTESQAQSENDFVSTTENNGQKNFHASQNIGHGSNSIFTQFEKKNSSQNKQKADSSLFDLSKFETPLTHDLSGTNSQNNNYSESENCREGTINFRFNPYKRFYTPNKSNSIIFQLEPENRHSLLHHRCRDYQQILDNKESYAQKIQTKISHAVEIGHLNSSIINKNKRKTTFPYPEFRSFQLSNGPYKRTRIFSNRFGAFSGNKKEVWNSFITSDIGDEHSSLSQTPQGKKYRQKIDQIMNRLQKRLNVIYKKKSPNKFVF